MHVSDLIEASQFLILRVLEVEVVYIAFLHIFDELAELVLLVQPAVNGVEVLSRLLVDLWIEVVRSVHEVFVVYLVIGEHGPSEKVVLGVFFLPHALEVFQEVQLSILLGHFSLVEDAVDDRSDICKVVSEDETYLDDVVKVDACEPFSERADFLEGHPPENELVLAHLQVNQEAQ